MGQSQGPTVEELWPQSLWPNPFPRDVSSQGKEWEGSLLSPSVYIHWRNRGGKEGMRKFLKEGMVTKDVHRSSIYKNPGMVTCPS